MRPGRSHAQHRDRRRPVGRRRQGQDRRPAHGEGRRSWPATTAATTPATPSSSASEQFVLHLIPSGILHPGHPVRDGQRDGHRSLGPREGDRRAARRGVAVEDNLVDLRPRAPDPAAPPRARGAGGGAARRAARSARPCAASGPPTRTRPAAAACAWATCCGPRTLPAKLEEARRHYEQICRGAGRAPEVDWDALVRDLAGVRRAAGAAHHRHVAGAAPARWRAGYSVLFEGAQATLLDIDHGTYPFVTSSSAAAGGAAHRPRRAAHAHRRRDRHRQGVHDARRRGPAALRDRRRARGGDPRARRTSSAPPPGRPRRCGWFDAVVVRYSVRVNGFDALALTKLDVLDELAEVKICTGYRYEGETLDEFPADLVGARRLRAGLRDAARLAAADRGRARLRDAARGGAALRRAPVGAGRREIGIVSTGPDRRTRRSCVRRARSRPGSNNTRAIPCSS